MAEAKVCDTCGRTMEIECARNLPFKYYENGEHTNIRNNQGEILPRFKELKSRLYKVEKLRQLDICDVCYEEYHKWLVAFIDTKIRNIRLQGVPKTSSRRYSGWFNTRSK